MDSSEYLSNRSAAIEDRIRRMKNTGRDEDDRVLVKLDAGKMIREIEIDYKKLGIKKDAAADIEDAVQEAVNAAMERYQRSVEKEMSKILES